MGPLGSLRLGAGHENTKQWIRVWKLSAPSPDLQWEERELGVGLKKTLEQTGLESFHFGEDIEPLEDKVPREGIEASLSHLPLPCPMHHFHLAVASFIIN